MLICFLWQCKHGGYIIIKVVFFLRMVIPIPHVDTVA